MKQPLEILSELQSKLNGLTRMKDLMGDDGFNGCTMYYGRSGNTVIDDDELLRKVNNTIRRHVDEQIGIVTSILNHANNVLANNISKEDLKPW